MTRKKKKFIFNMNRLQPETYNLVSCIPFAIRRKITPMGIKLWKTTKRLQILVKKLKP